MATSAFKLLSCCGFGGEERVIRGDDFVRRTAAEVAEALRAAAWGRSSWEEASKRLVAALPGSMASVVNYDLPRSSINAVFQYGYAPEFVASYLDRYVTVNPWMNFWAAQPDGHVSITERESPAHAFRNTEFYTDWLAPQGNAGAAVGMRLHVDPNNTIHLTWQYDVAWAARYDAVAAAVIEAVKPDIEQAVRGSSTVKRGLQQGLLLGDIIEHIDGMAMMIERDGRIREANAEAIAALQQEEVVAAAGDIVMMRDGAAQRWLEETLARLLDGLPAPSSTSTFSTGAGVFRAALTPAPHNTGINAGLLVPPRPRALLVIKVFIGRAVRLDVGSLHVAFGLSTAEVRLCEMLVNGVSLSESARTLGNSEGTVRQRIKMIFSKTGTHRQGELVALLARFRIPG